MGGGTEKLNREKLFFSVICITKNNNFYQSLLGIDLPINSSEICCILN